MKLPVILAATALLLSPAPTFAAGPEPADAELAAFRAAYISGAGLTYVVVPGEKGERIYRYGDASRRTVERDARGYMLFTCAAPHVFVPSKPEHKAALLKARIVRAGETEFAGLDAKYLAGCKNPLVKSALPRKK